MQIQTSLLPFDQFNRKTVELPEGLTLQQIVDTIIPPALGEFTAYITINGEEIHPLMWKSIRPKKNAIVGISIVPGKGGRSKNPLTTIISIVVAIAAPYLASTYAVSLGSAIFGNGVLSAGQLAFSSGLIRIGVSAVGFLASSALSSTPKQSTPSTSYNNNSTSTSSNVRDSPTQFIEGASNAILKWGVIPICLGTNRMFPPQAALPFTETQSGDQYVRQLFTFGYGEVEITDEKIGETPLANFTGLETSKKLNGDLADGTSLYANDVFQTDESIVLSSSAGYTTRRSQDAINEFEIDITFLSGLFNQDATTGKLNRQTVSFEVGYSVVGSGTWTTSSFSVSDGTSSIVRYPYRVSGLTTNQYDIRVRRTTSDTSSDRIRDEATWTALRSISHRDPFTEPNTSGLAMRIKATDQLNGTVDKYNAVVSALILDYDADSDTWIKRKTSNPASIYRYVLQNPAFVKALPDNRINLNTLKTWHTYCDSLGLKYDRVIDYETSIEDVLNDIAAAGFASRYCVEGIHGVIVDNEKPIIKGMVTPRNSWAYKGNISYPELPHALRVEFRNKDKGYAIDERVIYLEGYSESNATLYERIEFSSCTDADLAYIYGRRYLANIVLQPETHTFMMDIEALTFNRGDRITFVNDVILVGVGSGRIKSLVYDDEETPTTITGFVLDDTVTIPSASNFAVRIRYSDASDYVYHRLDTVVGATNEFTFTTPITLTEADEEGQLLGALCSFVEDGKELDLLVLETSVDKNHNMKIRAINYAPERFATDQEPIPSFNSNVTLPLTAYRPEAPSLAGDILSDETVLVRNTDGSFTTRMVIPLFNRNGKDVEPVVKIKRTGATQWSTPSYLSRSTEEVILTGLQDGSLYDFEIRYQNQGGVGLMSLPLILNNIRYVGGSTPPADVATFRISVNDDNNAILSWQKNTEIDISHYEIRYSAAYSGATWDTAQILEEKVYENRLTIAFRGGSYFIKAVDLSGNYSVNATGVITFNPGLIRNVVEELDEAADGFLGVKDNCAVEGDVLTLTDIDSDGYYYFNDTVDIGAVDISYVSANLSAGGIYVNDLFEIVDMFAEDDLFPASGSLDLFASENLFAVDDLFGIGTGAWEVELQYRTTPDDTLGTPTWSEWAKLTAGFIEFRGIQFRLLLRSLRENISVSISALSVLLDVPDRFAKGQDLTVPVEGVTITYDPAFWNNPSVQITLQDQQDGDEVEFVSKTSSGFTMKVYNVNSSAYVERTFDFITAGYGRR